MTPRTLVIIGAGGHGRVALDMAHAAGFTVRGYLDAAVRPHERINGVPVLGDDNWLLDRDFFQANQFLVALGHQATRRRISLQILQQNGELARIIHPSCIVSPSASIGAGSLLVAGAIVNANAQIGRFCIVNTGAVVDHDGQLADGVQLGPRATLASTVLCGEDAFIGTGASVIPRIKIGARAIVGAGAVVIRDVATETTVVGNPAKAR